MPNPQLTSRKPLHWATPLVPLHLDIRILLYPASRHFASGSPFRRQGMSPQSVCRLTRCSDQSPCARGHPEGRGGPTCTDEAHRLPVASFW